MEFAQEPTVENGTCKRCGRRSKILSNGLCSRCDDVLSEKLLLEQCFSVSHILNRQNETISKGK